MSPILSIITVNLNNAEGLRQTLESVMSQTFNEYEYLIVDGGSTDDSLKIIQRFSDNINFYISEVFIQSAQHGRHIAIVSSAHF